MVEWAWSETAANKCISFPGSNKWEWRKSVGTCRPETENSCCRPAGNNSSNVEHKLCIEFLWKLQQLPLDFLHPFSWKLGGCERVRLYYYQSFRSACKHAPCAARHRNRMGGWLPPNTRAWRVPKLAHCNSLLTWPIIWSAVLVSLNCKYVCLRP